MTNADKFKAVFGIYSEEFWAKPEGDMLNWISSEYQEPKTNADVQPVKWVPFSVRDLDEEEKAEHPEWDWILDGKLPEDGQRILVNVKFKGHESVQMDEYYEDDGCYLDSGYELGTEVTHWMPLPEPPKDGEA